MSILSAYSTEMTDLLTEQTLRAAMSNVYNKNDFVMFVNMFVQRNVDWSAVHLSVHKPQHSSSANFVTYFQ